jgi:hypothetical protein
VKQQDDYVPRSIRIADFLVVFAGLFHNLMSAFHAFSEEILEVATYNAIRQTQVSKAWENFAQDLEKMEEENG